MHYWPVQTKLDSGTKSLQDVKYLPVSQLGGRWRDCSGSWAATWFLGLASSSAQPAHTPPTALIAPTPKLCKDLGKEWVIRNHQELAVPSWASLSGVALWLSYLSTERNIPAIIPLQLGLPFHLTAYYHLLYITHFGTVANTEFIVLRHRWNAQVSPILIFATKSSFS